MLTGQCKNDFELWFEKKYPDHNIYFVKNEYPFICETSLIIEWFDSVGIYICTNITPITYQWLFCINKDYYDIRRKTRQEATKAAIEKANELYNDKFK